jgi:hypothetical protein
MNEESLRTGYIGAESEETRGGWKEEMLGELQNLFSSARMVESSVVIWNM